MRSVVVNKRGLSPIIATVLLIFLVLILASIVFLWAKGFFSEQLEKGGESVENQCNKVEFSVELAGGYSSNRNYVDLDFSNVGSVAIHQVSIREVSSTGGADARPFLVNLGAGESLRLEADLESSDLEELVIFPVVIGGVVGGDENKPFTCVDNFVRLVL